MSYRALFGRIAGVLGRPSPRLVIPASALRLVGALCSGLRDYLKLPLPLTRGLVEPLCRELYYSSALAERELGWRFRPIEPAIEDAIRWYRARGLL